MQTISSSARTFSAIALMTLAVGLSSCDKDEPLTPEELIALDPQAAWRQCGIGGYFQRDEPDGECLRCNTDAGYVRSGRNGEFCYAPEGNTGYRYARMVLFESAPQDWWPSDTLYFANNNDGTDFGFGFGSGKFSTLGISLSGTEWIPPGCPEEDVNRQATYARGGPSYVSFQSSSGRNGFYNGEEFSFLIVSVNANEDCHADFGYVTGRTERDTSFADVSFVSVWGPADQRGDTISKTSFIMVEAPAWTYSR